MTTTATPDIRFDVPLYALAEAARSLGVPSTTFANWGKGYVRRFPSRKPVTGDPIVTVLARPGR
ncbi:MAG: hypothetical protein M3N32_02245 [Actinomycetota bacterium]|nr:hypothetical protein [Actinomycetota bacterium]